MLAVVCVLVHSFTYIHTVTLILRARAATTEAEAALVMPRWWWAELLGLVFGISCVPELTKLATSEALRSLATHGAGTRDGGSRRRAELS